jgi:cell division protein FtsW
VIGEELGFVGVLHRDRAFFWLTRRIFVIGRQAVKLDRVFAGLWRRASASGSAARPSSTWA